jgi:hypothetical protein
MGELYHKVIWVCQAFSSQGFLPLFLMAYSTAYAQAYWGAMHRIDNTKQCGLQQLAKGTADGHALLFSWLLPFLVLLGHLGHCRDWQTPNVSQVRRGLHWVFMVI